MLNWLKLIFIGRPICEHKWKQINCYEKSSALDGRVVADIYLLQCEKCGDMKNHKVSAFG